MLAGKLKDFKSSEFFHSEKDCKTYAVCAPAKLELTVLPVVLKSLNSLTENKARGESFEYTLSWK